jgi:hypothetical protein
MTHSAATSSDAAGREAAGSDTPSEAESAPRRSPWLSEDWAATIVGLLLVILVLAGVIGKGLIP